MKEEKPPSTDADKDKDDPVTEREIVFIIVFYNKPPAERSDQIPNLGIARALVVILLIHVVAILGIFVHSHYEQRREEKADRQKQEQEALEQTAPVE